MSSPKILPLPELVKAVDKCRAQGRVIVTANGSFDLLHVGHLRFLEEARAQGNTLVVGVNSDESVRRYKSPTRPINPEAHRAALVAGLEAVDFVCLFDESDPRAFLSHIKPDVHVNGVEYGEDCIERDVVVENGGRIHLVKHNNDISSTALAEKVAGLYDRVKKNLNGDL